MILVWGPIPNVPPNDNQPELTVHWYDCSDGGKHSEHFHCLDSQMFYCRGVKSYRPFPLCQVAHPEVREALPCKYEESGGYQCENLEPHTIEHKFGHHTITHSIAGNGYSCEAFS